MEYRVAVRKTVTIGMWFDANSDEEAEEKAREFYENADCSDAFGDPEYDYMIRREDGSVLVDWD